MFADVLAKCARNTSTSYAQPFWAAMDAQKVLLIGVAANGDAIVAVATAGILFLR